MGTWVEGWREAKAQNLTFIVTEDCNLRCKYCYVTHKSSNARMTFETAKKFIDYIFKIKRNEQHAVILDFIGGEPFLEIDLIDQICDYFKIKAFELNDEWYWNYRINVCTNGVNYNAEKIQNFIKKNHMKLSVTISIDGIKENPRVYTSTSIMELEELPERLVIVGGGYIGLEFASMYASFGSKVTVLEGYPELIGREDRDIAASVQTVLE